MVLNAQRAKRNKKPKKNQERGNTGERAREAQHSRYISKRMPRGILVIRHRQSACERC
jgi:hypothetical protein